MGNTAGEYFGSDDVSPLLIGRILCKVTLCWVRPVCLALDFYSLRLGLLSARGWQSTPLQRHSSWSLELQHIPCADRSANETWHKCYLLICTSPASAETGGPAAGRETRARWKLQMGDCCLWNLIIQGTGANYRNWSWSKDGSSNNEAWDAPKYS